MLVRRRHSLLEAIDDRLRQPSYCPAFSHRNRRTLDRIRRRKGEPAEMCPKIIRNRERVVSKDDLLAAVCNGGIVSESTLSTRINAARSGSATAGENNASFAQRTAKGPPLSGPCARKKRSAYSFENFSLDTARRELRRSGLPIALQPQVFDLIEYSERSGPIWRLIHVQEHRLAAASAFSTAG